MADESMTDTITAELRDGQLQIVEVAPYDRDAEGEETEEQEQELDSELGEMSNVNGSKQYVQLVEDEKGVMQLNLLNFALVRCDDDQTEYRLVSNSDIAQSDGGDETTITCVLREEGDGDGDEQEGSYVVMDDDQAPLVLLQSPNVETQNKSTQEKKTTESKTTKQQQDLKTSSAKSDELIDKLKILQRTKEIVSPNRRGRKRKSDLPPAHELLSSPNFKLYLYNCKQCSFKCNAIKELTAHRASEHGGGGGARWRGGAAAAGAGPGGRSPVSVLQCARCPFRASSQLQLLKHAKQRHAVELLTCRIEGEEETEEQLTEEVKIRICGVCGFETSSRTQFNEHIEQAHST